MSASLKGITSKNIDDSYCLNCLRSFRMKNKLNKLIDFCEIVLPSQNDNILRFSQYMKSDITPDMIYADLE